jgi:hypothetical protein
MESEPSRLWIVREAFLFRRVQWRSYTLQGFAQYHTVVDRQLNLKKKPGHPVMSE